METIRLKCKLKAYTLGIHTEYLRDAPKDGHIYGRKDGEWESVDKFAARTQIELEENSGLHLSHDEETHTYILGVNQENILESELPEDLEPDTVYYVVDTEPNTYVDGGTAFSNGDNEYVIESQFGDITNGGIASSEPDIILYPTNAEGEYNG